jgi:hypothetical protein
MPRYRVEIQATAIGIVDVYSAATADEALAIARDTWTSSDFDMWEEIEFHDVEEVSE